MHAIDAGNVILEIQQNSDTTYRVYDWGRVGLDGKPRSLHVQQSLECLSANDAPAPRLVRAQEGSGVLAQCREFTIRQVRLRAGERLEFVPRQQPRILSVVAGSLEANAAIRLGDTLLVPYANNFAYTATADITFLITENFGRV
jgi:mannose-6-phosphate isomerase